MICRVKRAYVKKLDKIIQHFVAKSGNFMIPDLLISRVIWNYFTNSNKERKRAKRIIDKILYDNNIKIDDILNKK